MGTLDTGLMAVKLPVFKITFLFYYLFMRNLVYNSDSRIIKSKARWTAFDSNGKQNGTSEKGAVSSEGKTIVFEVDCKNKRHSENENDVLVQGEGSSEQRVAQGLKSTKRYYFML